MSTRTNRPHVDCGKQTCATIRAEADALHDLGAADGSFTWTEASETEAISAIKRLNETQALIKTRQDDGLLECRLSENARQFLEDVLENRETWMPCGHSGITKTPEGYECLYEPCDRVATREEVDT